MWFEALRHTQVTGIPLKDQQTTSYGVPIIVHKCIQFVEVHGMEVEGIYRHSGQRAKIQKLTLEFNQGLLVERVLGWLGWRHSPSSIYALYVQYLCVWCRSVVWEQIRTYGTAYSHMYIVTVMTTLVLLLCWHALYVCYGVLNPSMLS